MCVGSPVGEQSQSTDGLIDGGMYRLYGVNAEEVGVVEGDG